MSYLMAPKDADELKSRLKEMGARWIRMRSENESIYGRNNPVALAIARCTEDLVNAMDGVPAMMEIPRTEIE